MCTVEYHYEVAKDAVLRPNIVESYAKPSPFGHSGYSTNQFTAMFWLYLASKSNDGTRSVFYKGMNVPRSSSYPFVTLQVVYCTV